MATPNRDRAIALGGVLCGVVGGVLLERLGRRFWGDGKRALQNSSDVVKSGKDVFVDREALEGFVANIVWMCGVTQEKAVLVARVLVAADCRGVPSHGVNRAEMYCGELRAGLIDSSAEPEIVKETASVATVDGNNGLGAVVSKFAMNLAIQKARQTGIGLVVCRRSNHFGIAGFWAEFALREKMIGFSFTNTSPFMVPTRTCTRAGGTNPISFYCPAGPGDSFQLDMATTTVPVGKVEVCHRKGQKLPLGWGVDASGTRSTTDPVEVMARGGLTPLGGLEETAGYKGYGLNMMVEILSAVLSGCDHVGPDVPPWKVDRGCPVDYGHCFLAIDPDKLVSGDQFQDVMAAYLARMRGLQPADLNYPVLVPGDPEREEERLASKQGVRLNEKVALGLRALAREVGCTEDILPAPIRELPEVAAPKHFMAKS